jgi:phage RecT family recombinase
MLPQVKQRYPDLPITSSDIVMLAKSGERCPELLQCSVPSIMGSLVEARSMGWGVDGMTGQAYLVPFSKKATLMPGYRGWMDLIRRSGQCEPSMDTIHDCDVFAWDGNTFSKPNIHVSAQGDRRSKPITGAYVQGLFYQQGFTKTFYWPYAQIIAHRDRYSQAWKRSPKQDNPWHPEHPGHWVMCAKTVLIDAAKRQLPLSKADLRFIQRAEQVDAIDATHWEEADETDQVAASVAQDIAAGGATDQSINQAVDPLAAFRASVAHVRVIPNLASKLQAFVAANPTLRKQAEQIAQQREIEIENPA